MAYVFHSRYGCGLTFAVKGRPRAQKNAVTGELGDAIKVSITAPPVDGKANEACIQLLANLLNVPRSSVTIASGQNRRNKVIRVTRISAQELRQRLAAVMPTLTATRQERD